MLEFFGGLLFRSKVFVLVVVIFIAIMAIAISFLYYSRANLAETLARRTYRSETFQRRSRHSNGSFKSAIAATRYSWRRPSHLMKSRLPERNKRYRGLELRPLCSRS